MAKTKPAAKKTKKSAKKAEKGAEKKAKAGAKKEAKKGAPASKAAATPKAPKKGGSAVKAKKVKTAPAASSTKAAAPSKKKTKAQVTVAAKQETTSPTVNKKSEKPADKKKGKVAVAKGKGKEAEVAEKVAKAQVPAQAKKAPVTTKVQTKDLELEEGEIRSEKEAAPKHVEVDEVQTKFVEDLATLSADFDWTDIRAAIMNMGFYNETDADECLEKTCENLPVVQGFCRLHYITNWKGIKKKRTLLEEGKLQSYVEEIVNKYPLKYIEEILNDLKDDREFFKVLRDLNIDSAYNVEDGETLDEDDSDDIVVETRVFADHRTGIDDDEV